MNWHITSSIYGGAQYAPATMAEYTAIAESLVQSAADMRASATAWTDTAIALQRHRASMSICDSADSSASSGVYSHATFPFSDVAQRCSMHAQDCTRLGNELTQMADLLIRAHSLYSQAEAENRRLMTELVQGFTQLFPKHMFIGAGALAAGGALYGSFKEGKLNATHALTSTAWAQEGLMSGLGAMVGAVPIRKGLSHTDEVNTAAKRVAGVTAPAYDLVQGNTLHVTQVVSNSDVIQEPHSVAEAMEGLRRLGEERLGKIDLNSGLEYGTIAISQYRKADGSTSWLVTIPGTDGKADSPFGWPQNVELMSGDKTRRMKADSARMVAEAMERAGIGADEPVAMIGHSQGGIVAATLASDWSDTYNIEHIVTAGSPVANHPVSEDTWVTSVEIDDELVAALDGAENPAIDTWLTIRGTSTYIPDSIATTVNDDGSCTPGMGAGALNPFVGATVKDQPDGKEITHWLKYHQAAYRNATDLGSPALQQHEEHFQNILDGELVETTYWQGRMQRSLATAPAQSNVTMQTIGR